MVRDLATALAGQGLQVDLFTNWPQSVCVVRPLSPSIRLISLPAEMEGDEVAAAKALGRAGIRSDGYEAVHSHYWRSLFLAKALAESSRAPLVHTFHSLSALMSQRSRSASTQRRPERERAEALLLHQVDAVLTGTEAELSWLRPQSSAAVSTAPPGIDPRLFQPPPPGAPRAAGTAIELLAVGRVTRLKGFDLAIETVAALKRLTSLPVHLTIVGGPAADDGQQEMERLRRLAANLGVAADCRFIGVVSRRRLRDYFVFASVLLVTSEYESFSMAALEAQACGTPVIGTAVGFLPALAHIGACLLARCRTAEEFARCVMSLRSLAAADLAAAAADAARRWSLQRAVASHRAVYGV